MRASEGGSNSLERAPYNQNIKSFFLSFFLDGDGDFRLLLLLLLLD